MTDDTPLELDRPLYRRWRSAARRPGASADSLAVSAYAERRLDETTAEPVERAFAANPEMFDAVLDARRGLTPEPVSAELIARMQAIVPWPASADVIALRPRSRSGYLGGVLAWGALAASVLVVSLVGFNLGVETQQKIERPSANAPVDLLGETDSPVG